LFDEGTQRSFVSQKLADQLQLHTHNTENISISTFGAESAISQQLSTAIIDVITLNSDVVPVTGLVILNIATPLLTSFHACINAIPYLKGIMLAHPVSRKENSFLIGADQY